jgi:hypothetical protein
MNTIVLQTLTIVNVINNNMSQLMMSLLYRGRGQSSQLFRGCLNGGCPTDTRTVMGHAWLSNSRDRPYDARDAFDRWIIW